MTRRGPLAAMTRAWLTGLFGLSLLGSACGSPAAPPAPTPIPPDEPTITITAAGVSPHSVVVSPGGRVLFVNNDSASHNVSSDPHPERDQCPAINQVGYLQPGDSRETGNFVTAGTCGFHDFDMAFVAALQGTITVQ